MAYRIVYSPATHDHLRELTARQRTMIFDAVEAHLIHQPEAETKNRKPMRPNPIAPWELRTGNLRVYYDVATEPELLVTILAVGVKRGNRVVVGGEEMQL